MMAADTMEALGIPRGSYVVKVNNRKVLDGLMESVELGGPENTGRRLTVLRAVDKLDRLGLEGVRQLLGQGRKDESGDITPGANLSDEQSGRIVQFVQTMINLADVSERDPVEYDYRKRGKPIRVSIADRVLLDLLEKAFPSEMTLFWQGVDELFEMCSLVRAAGYSSDRIKFDLSVVRGLEYYTGPVYEVELLLDTTDEKGRPVRFGSVGGGGRYDGLVSRFRGEVVPATGFSIGVSRLQAALTLLGKLDSRPDSGPVVVTVFDRDRVADYQRMVAQLRGAGIRAELYLGNPKNMGNQLKYADRRNAPCVIIQGSDEKAKGKVQVKDLILGAGLTTTEDRDEYLKKQAEAQTEVDESELVAAVRKILARHAVTWMV
jgi:histidyl-tRNA synthetase